MRLELEDSEELLTMLGAMYGGYRVIFMEPTCMVKMSLVPPLELGGVRIEKALGVGTRLRDWRLAYEAVAPRTPFVVDAVVGRTSWGRVFLGLILVSDEKQLVIATGCDISPSGLKDLMNRHTLLVIAPCSDEEMLAERIVATTEELITREVVASGTVLAGIMCLEGDIDVEGLPVVI